jgi:two-component system, OmpR family, alkaline phosphatase synthesis response regulator PhoP
MPKSILIADDELHIRALLEQTLEDLEDQGVELLIATNGQEALDTIKEAQPDLVFLDVMMPKLDGYQVCYEVKHTLQLTDTCIVLLTAKGQEADQKKGYEAGADIYMTKPFDPDELLAKAQDILGLQSL